MYGPRPTCLIQDEKLNVYEELETVAQSQPPNKHTTSRRATIYFLEPKFWIVRMQAVLTRPDLLGLLAMGNVRIHLPQESRYG